MQLPQIRTVGFYHTSDVDKLGSDLLVVIVDEQEIKAGKVESQSLKALDSKVGGVIAELAALKDFEGKWLQSSISLSTNKAIAKRVLLLGAGSSTALKPARARQLGIAAAETATKIKVEKVSVVTSSQLFSDDAAYTQLAVGFNLGAYSFPSAALSGRPQDNLETPLELHLVSQKNLSAQVSAAQGLSSAINVCRLLQDGPPNQVTPKFVSEVISEKARAKGLSVTVWGAQKLREMGFNAMMAVGGGSSQEPQFVVVEYKPKNYKKTIALVGKGLTMDSGGYSLKTPSPNQEGMKYDMSGAAVTLSSVLAIADLGLPVRVFAVAALCENMIDAHAYRVGDVLKSYSGKTIEVLNTDAEGRIVLSDALSYTAQELKPDCIFEFSTLTGAMVVSLGKVGAGVFAFDDSLGKAITEASSLSGDRVHLFPTWEEYDEDIKTPMADLRNIGAAGQAGSVTAAMFLKEFVHGVPFAHIDIAGVADNNKAMGYPRKLGSGFGVLLSTEIARKFSEN